MHILLPCQYVNLIYIAHVNIFPVSTLLWSYFAHVIMYFQCVNLTSLIHVHIFPMSEPNLTSYINLYRQRVNLTYRVHFLACEGTFFQTKILTRYLDIQLSLYVWHLLIINQKYVPIQNPIEIKEALGLYINECIL